MNTIEILGNIIYITESCPTFLRIGHVSKKLEASVIFLDFDVKQQELFVMVTINLIPLPSHMPAQHFWDNFSEENRYNRADLIAIDFMMKRYPEKHNNRFECR